MSELLELAERQLKEIIAERDCYYEGITDAAGVIEDEDDINTLSDWDARIDEAQAIIAKAKADIKGHYTIQIPKEIKVNELNHVYRNIGYRLNRHGEGNYRAFPVMGQADAAA